MMVDKLLRQSHGLSGMNDCLTFILLCKDHSRLLFQDNLRLPFFKIILDYLFQDNLRFIEYQKSRGPPSPDFQLAALWACLTLSLGRSSRVTHPRQMTTTSMFMSSPLIHLLLLYYNSYGRVNIDCRRNSGIPSAIQRPPDQVDS